MLTRDAKILFLTRSARLFAYGVLSVILVLYLTTIGLDESAIGLLLTLTLAGDTAISLWLTTAADRLGRRRTLAIGAWLMIVAGVVFSLTGNFWLLLLAATVGVISPSGNEVGPFLPVEQAGLSQLVPDRQRTSVFAWYNLAGSFSTAFGALLGGALAQALQSRGATPLESYRVVLWIYVAIGFVLGLGFRLLSPAIEAARPESAPLAKRWGLHRSTRVVLKLSALFSLDAFAGGFVIQSFLAYWLHRRFGADAAELGAIFFGANILAGLSQPAAAWLARRIGLVNTMVFTHLPSNLLLMLVPFMPSLGWAVGVLLVRYAISQMDVPTRQSYTMAVVAPDERVAAAGITGVARTVGASLSPVLTGIFLKNPALMSTPLLIAGGLKIVYDLLLYREFVLLKPPEEGGAQGANQ
ncbi:MAG: MFS transporter [Oligoflexia bacterium]|nr:MFS transporter [Oligoflexia bacterium]